MIPFSVYRQAPLYIVTSLALIPALLIGLFYQLDGYNDQRVVLVGLLVCLSPLAALSQGFRLHSLTVAGGGLFLLAVLVSTGWPVSHQSALVEAVFSPAYLAAIVGLVWLWRVQQAPLVMLSHVVLILVSAALLYALVAVMIYVFALTDNLQAVSIHLPWGVINIRAWSHLATWSLPLLPLAVLAGPFRQSRLWYLAVAFTGAIWWWLVFFSMSRGSMVGLMAGVLFVGLLFGRQCLPWFRLFILYFSLGAVTWLVLSWLLPMLLVEEVLSRPFRDHTSGRMPLWGEAWQMSLQHFPFGMGPQSWLTHAPLTEAYAKAPPIGGPHNIYLKLASEYGWLSVAGLAIIGCDALRRLWQQRCALLAQNAFGEHGILLAGVTASVTAAIIHSGASGVFGAPASMLMGLVILSGFWLLISYQSAPTSSGTSKYLPYRGLVAAALLVVMLLWSHQVGVYYHQMQAYVQSEEKSAGRSSPRFWSYGHFPDFRTIPASTRE